MDNSRYNIILKVHASSLEKAKELSENFHSIESILVGGKHYQAISTIVIQRAYGFVNFNELPPDQAGAVFVRSVFMPKHSYNGMLYRVGEHCVIVNPQGTGRTIMRVCDVFSFNIDQIYHNFLERELYAQDDENPLTHSYSSNSIMKCEHVMTTCLASHIVRKVSHTKLSMIISLLLTTIGSVCLYHQKMILYLCFLTREIW